MKPIRKFTLAAILLFVLAAGPARSQPTTPVADTNTAPPAEMETPLNEFPRYNNHPIVFTDYTLEKGRTNYGDLVVIKGRSTVDGRVEGNSVTVMGNARINGYLAHDLVVVMGSAELGPNAVIDGDAVVVGGALIRSPGAKIRGEETVVDLEKIPGFHGSVEWVTEGLLYGRPLPLHVPWARNIAGVFLLVNLLLLLLFPRPIQACVDTMEKRPIGSLFAGLLVKLLVGLVCLLLICTVVGVLVVPFLIAGFIVSFLFGKITIYRYVGQQLGRQLNVGFLQGPVVSLIIGTVIFYLLYSVPFLGFVAWGFTGIFGLGAVGMTLAETYRSERKKNSPPRAPTPLPPAPAPTPVYFAAPAPTPAPMDAPVATPPAGDPGMAFTASATPAAPAPFPSSAYVPPAPSVPFVPVPSLTPPEADVLVRAGFWIRLCAFALDAFLFLIPIIFIGDPGRSGPVLFLWLVYHVGLWTWRGTTVGGIVTGLKVVRLDGRPMNFGTALIRALASVFSAFVLGLGFIWTSFSPEKQSWHDKIAGTVIVKVPNAMSLILAGTNSNVGNWLATGQVCRVKQAVTVATPTAKPLLIYDGECNFCKFWIMRMREFTVDRLDFIASQDPRVGREFPELPREWFDTSVQLLEPDGSVYAGAEAAFRALSCWAPGSALTWMYAIVPGFAPASERAYKLVAERREFFSKLTRLLWGRDGTVPRYDRVRWVFLRLLGVIYLIAFASLGVQIKGLIGTDGVDPAAELMVAARQHFDSSQVGLERYHRLPTLCWLASDDRFLQGLCVAGGLVSVALILNFAPALCLALLWLIYLSLMSVGGDFLSFQWDALLLETGFFALFLAPVQILAWRRVAPPSRAALWLLRWLLFQLMFESGVVKLASGDPSWRHLFALNYHYETQPLPTWIGWYAHQLPDGFQKLSVLILFFIELAVPFLLFAPRRLRIGGAVLLIFLQVMILLTGNYCFFNLLTIALCILWLDDATVARFIPSRWRGLWMPRQRSSASDPRPSSSDGTMDEICIPPVVTDSTPHSRGWPRWFIRPVALAILLVTFTGMLGRFGWLRMPSPILALEEWLGPFQTLNHYGLFAVMTTSRPEIILEGSQDGKTWLPYEFKYQAGDVNRRPAFVAPHQPRLDWQMWFAALRPKGRDRWFIGLCVRLLQGSPEVLALLERNPFPGAPPRYIRAEYYDYHFTNFAERRATGAWWRRNLIGEYLQPISLPDK